MALVRIAGGRLIDPANGVDAARDVWISDGVVVDGPPTPDSRVDRTIDARGLVVMPGGVDVHSHIAGPKVNAARLLRPEEPRRAGMRHRGGTLRSGTLGSVPSTFTTAYQYLGLGYTTAVDAAIAPLGARQALLEFADTPTIDKALLVLAGNNHYVMERIREGDRGRLRDYVAWLMNATRAYGIKVVNPGGVEAWKQGRGNVSELDELVPHFDVSPRRIMVELARAVDELKLPHPVHLHGQNLGLPGNAASTLETFRALEGHRAHFAHIQFHSYGGAVERPSSIDSQVAQLADYFNAHANLTADVGQIMFGETTSMTADGAVGQFLHQLTGRKWISHDVEQETGCGIVPITYDDKNLVHATQWAIGLEWFLRTTDPWRLALSTDHPNGSTFLSYPRIIAMLMDSGLRQDTLAALPNRVRARSGLAELTREYSLSEIAIVTRAAPARILGLSNKGHLGPGADGDVTMYQPDDDKERMFALPRYVLKRGDVVLDDGELRPSPEGHTLSSKPGFDPAILPDIKSWFDSNASIRFANFAVAEPDNDKSSEAPIHDD